MSGSFIRIDASKLLSQTLNVLRRTAREALIDHGAEILGPLAWADLKTLRRIERRLRDPGLQVLPLSVPNELACFADLAHRAILWLVGLEGLDAPPQPKGLVEGAGTERVVFELDGLYTCFADSSEEFA